MQAAHGYKLSLDGTVAVDVPIQQYGFNRLRFLSNRCATALLAFSTYSFEDEAERLCSEIAEKVNALRIGYIKVEYKGGSALFLFDWLMRAGQKLSLKGNGKGDYTVLVEPLTSPYIKEISIRLGCLADLMDIVYADPNSDFNRYYCFYHWPERKGELLDTRLLSFELNSRPWSEKEMLAKLLGVKAKDVLKIGPAVTENSFLLRYRPLISIPYFMRAAIDRPITLPDGSKRSMKDV